MGKGVGIALGALSLVGGGLSFFGAQQQAAAAERMGQYNYAVQKAQMEMQAAQAAQVARAQAEVSAFNAATAQNEAARVENEARERARRIREDNRRLIGSQIAAYGKSGVAMEGSPLAIVSDTAAMGELSAADAMYEGDAKRQSLLGEAQIHNYQRQFSLLNQDAQEWNRANAGAFAMPHLIEGRNKASALRMQGFSSLLSGAGSALFRAK